MGNMIQKGIERLRQLMETHNSVTVTYYRDDVPYPGIIATIGRTVFSQQRDGGFSVIFGDRDYLISVDQFPLDVPMLGDYITEELNGATKRFELLEPQNNEPAWRWSDAGHTTFRIHTKLVN